MIKLRSLKTKDNADNILNTLENVFGNTRSMPKRQRRFFDIKQKEGISLRAFSQTLLKLFLKHATVIE